MYRRFPTALMAAVVLLVVIGLALWLRLHTGGGAPQVIVPINPDSDSGEIENSYSDPPDLRGISIVTNKVVTRAVKAGSIRPLNEIPKIAVPKIDLDEVVKKADLIDKKRANNVFRFAESIDVNITPENSGIWETLPDGREIWRILISSPGALSLNFGFLKYNMPEGGRLSVFPVDQADDRPTRSFSAEDNEDHGQLWTPILRGDELVVEVILPAGQRKSLVLELSKVNHGFRDLKSAKIGGGDTSGSCNIDVACTADPTVGVLIQAFADQIRAVGAYTLEGIDACSGALTNNSNNDGKGYFLTAEHCGISPANAPSMVVYFNFENSSCRTPGSAASGAVGDGSLAQFNSGAIYRAENAASDFCLVELDDPIPASYNVFYAGWDRSGANGPAIGIHHPAVTEKRISFDLDDTVDDGATHVRVIDWDYGTTEGGSSGSPLFDMNGRIIGDLTGGTAECGNDEYDVYGRLSVSWTGGGSTATRLSNWLDPTGSGLMTLDGVNQDDSLGGNNVQITEGNNGTQTLDFTISLNRVSADTVTVQYTTFDGTASTADNDYLATSGTLTFNPSDTSKLVSVTINGDTNPEEHETFELRLDTPSNAIINGSSGIGTIKNDDFITPVITSSLSATGFSGEPVSYQITANNTPTSYSIFSAPAAMTIDASTGIITWIPTSSGQSTVTIIATNPAGSDSETLLFDISENSLAIALNSTLTFTEGADKWTLQTSQTHDGIAAAQSPVLADDQSAYFQTQITTGASGDAVTFWWKVSSEADFDFLRLLVNGVLVQEISGEVDWTQVTLPLAANSTTTLRWEYVKDEVVSSGNDRGYVDELALASDDPLPTFTSSATSSGAAGQGFSFDVDAFGATSFSSTALPAGLELNAGSGLISGTPTTVGSTLVTITATNGNGSRDQSLQIEIAPLLPDAVNANLPQITWTSLGDEGWFSQLETSYDGMAAAKSGPITDSQTSTLSATVNFDGAQILSFWWKVSSEETFDFLRFKINETENDSLSGEVDWIQKTGIAVPFDSQTYTWEYSKDDVVSVGSDAGWLDEVVFSYKIPAVGNVTASDGTLFPSNEVTVSWDAVSGVNSYRVFRNTVNDQTSANQIASVSVAFRTYWDTTAVPGVNYYYWVRAYSTVDHFGASGASDIGFITPDGPMTVSLIDPTSGRIGEVVTITGTNLDKVRQVKFGAIYAVFTPISATSISVILPVGFATGPITLINNSNSIDTAVFTKIIAFSGWLEEQAAAAGVVFVPGTVEELANRDDDDDQISNGAEFGLGTNPFVADTQVTEIDTTADPPVFRFNRAIAHLTYEVRTSTTLAANSWVTRASNPGVVGGIVEVQIQAAWAANGKVFARVVVSGFK